MNTYADQYHRIKRSIKKCQEIYATGGHSGMFWDTSQEKREEVLDAFYNLFMHLYHLKDWIKNDQQLSQLVRDSVELFLETNSDLQLLADVANAIKHLELGAKKSHKVRVSKDTKTQIIPLLTGPVGTFPVGGFYGFSINITTGNAGKDVEAMQFARSCLSKWEIFLKQHSLPF